MTKKTYIVTVSQVSNFSVEAETQEQAEKLALDRLIWNAETTVLVNQNATGWEMTDCEEAASDDSPEEDTDGGDMDGDAASALASAGFGTDEDYGGTDDGEF